MKRGSHGSDRVFGIVDCADHPFCCLDHCIADYSDRSGHFLDLPVVWGSRQKDVRLFF